VEGLEESLSLVLYQQSCICTQALRNGLVFPSLCSGPIHPRGFTLYIVYSNKCGVMPANRRLRGMIPVALLLRGARIGDVRR
jgi:hypothetical protein